jgi:hypothetical protein
MPDNHSATVAYVKQQLKRAVLNGTYIKYLLGNQISQSLVLGEPLTPTHFGSKAISCTRLRLDTTVLHIPSIHLVAAGMSSMETYTSSLMRRTQQ